MIRFLQIHGRTSFPGEILIIARFIFVRSFEKKNTKDDVGNFLNNFVNTDFRPYTVFPYFQQQIYLYIYLFALSFVNIYEFLDGIS